jgi:hypothetical protein
MTWTAPEVDMKTCRAGEQVTITRQANVLKAGGRVVNKTYHMTLKCSKAPPGSRFMAGERQPWMCEDCNVVN